MPYGHRPVNRFTPRGICQPRKTGTMHTPGKLQSPGVSDAPTAPLSQGRARRIHNHARHGQLRCPNTGAQRNLRPKQPRAARPEFLFAFRARTREIPGDPRDRRTNGRRSTAREIPLPPLAPRYFRLTEAFATRREAIEPRHPSPAHRVTPNLHLMRLQRDLWPPG